MKKVTILISTLFLFTSAYAGMSDSDKNRAWECRSTWLIISYHQVKHLNIV